MYGNTSRLINFYTKKNISFTVLSPGRYPNIFSFSTIETERQGPDHQCGPIKVRGPIDSCGPKVPLHHKKLKSEKSKTGCIKDMLFFDIYFAKKINKCILTF